ncbi:MAG: hypothetical protein OZSIB_1748 [Candidatus Ozemobacter sibiricus]|uniref:Uncharacterized protein n=1 Tax=Candidatus Ozemobacter sibiricus TaxID=2268124 RepID=A0A367ZK34_9BACT|nr:MAG: hypothetical protein OZSIB_1748 [Candidatus Ozemobacter sibiricus]
MLIRSKNRVYYFDRHISDAVLRLLVFAFTLLAGVTTWLTLARPDAVIDAVFWPRLQDEIAFLTGREVTKLGTSEKTLFTQAHEEMEKDGAGITSFPEYADRISPNNQSVEMVRLRLRDLRIALRIVGLLVLDVFILGLLVLRVIYGSAPRRWKVLQWLYGLFNKDGAGRQPYGYVHSFSPLQRKVFEMAFAASKGNPDGRFDLDLDKLVKLLFPGDDVVTEKRRALTAIAFTELCEEYFYFQIPTGKTTAIKTYCPILPFEDKVRRETVRDLAGREIEVFTAGTFRFSPPLYQEYLKYRYVKLPHPVIYSIDDRKHPFAFRLYLTLWEALYDLRQQSDKEIATHTVTLSLFTLLDRACLEMTYDKDASLLEAFHSDLAALKEAGFIRGWSVEEHGDKVHPQWYKGVELYSYDAATNTYFLNSNLLKHKAYIFEMTPYAELDKIKIVRRRCAYIDSLNTPCTRPALPGSPYCKRHARAMDYESPRLFYEKVKALTGPTSGEGTPPPPAAGAPESPGAPPTTPPERPTAGPDGADRHGPDRDSSGGARPTTADESPAEIVAGPTPAPGGADEPASPAGPATGPTARP